MRASRSGAGKSKLRATKRCRVLGFRFLNRFLVARVVRHHQHEFGRCRQQLAGPVQGKLAAVVRQRMKDHRGVLASLDHLVQVADCPLAHRPGQGSVLPHRLLALDEEPAEQVRGRQIVVAGHGVERTTESGPPCSVRNGSCRIRWGPSAGRAGDGARPTGTPPLHRAEADRTEGPPRRPHTRSTCGPRKGDVQGADRRGAVGHLSHSSTRTGSMPSSDALVSPGGRGGGKIYTLRCHDATPSERRTAGAARCATSARLVSAATILVRHGCVRSRWC